MYFRKFNPIALFITSSVSFFFVTFFCFATVMEGEEALAFTNFIQTIIQTTQGTHSGSTCILGNDEISKIIIAQDKQAINLNSAPTKFHSCKAIYMAKGREKGIGSEIEKYNNLKILTIAVFDGFTDMGGMLQVQMGRRNFEIILNSKTLKDSGVKLSPLATDLVIN